MQRRRDVLPSGGPKVPEQKMSPGGANITAGAAISKAADATTLYDGIEPALVARVANQINEVSPGLLDALGYSLVPPPSDRSNRAPT